MLAVLKLITVHDSWREVIPLMDASEQFKNSGLHCPYIGYSMGGYFIPLLGRTINRTQSGAVPEGDT